MATKVAMINQGLILICLSALGYRNEVVTMLIEITIARSTAAELGPPEANH